MVNPHDTPSPHSRDWDERANAEERSLSRGSGGSGYTRPPTDWSRVNNSSTYRSYNTGTGTGYVPQKGRSRKIAAVIISVFFIAIIGMFLFGDGSFTPSDWILIPIGDITESIGDITESIGDITEPIRSVIEPCEVYGSIPITSGTTKGEISLKLCPIKDKKMLTVSGDLSKSAQVHLTLLNPNMKKIQDVTFVKKEFSHTIGKELYSKDAGEWRINVIVSGKLQGVLKFMFVK